MKMKRNQTLVLKLNNLNKSVFMPVMAICLLFYSTAFNKMLGGLMETGQNIFAIFILAIIGLNLLLYSKDQWKDLFKANSFVIIYFIIRMITLYSTGFAYTAIRSVFFELFFLIGICSLTSGTEKNLHRMVSLFLYFELILSTLCVLIYFIVPLSGESITAFFIEHTMYEKFQGAALFVNENTAGIMAAFALIFLYFIFDREKNRKRKIITGLLIVYQMIFFLFQHCRSAEVALLVVIAVIIFGKIFRKVNGKKLVAAICILCVISIAGIYVLEIQSINNTPFYLSESEETLNNVLSNRFSIWKGCIIEQESHQLLGAGSLSLEQDHRKEIVANRSYGWRMNSSAELGPHNGYIGIISATGWLGFLAFLAVLYSKIKRSRLLEEGNWYLLVIFTLIVNLFESLFILNRFFLCFYMFMIFEAEKEENLEGRK